MTTPELLRPPPSGRTNGDELSVWPDFAAGGGRLALDGRLHLRRGDLSRVAKALGYTQAYVWEVVNGAKPAGKSGPAIRKLRAVFGVELSDVVCFRRTWLRKNAKDTSVPDP